MVSEMNEYFKMAGIKDIYDKDFSTLGWLLSKADCYHGFNYFKADGTLSGGENADFHHLEYYVI